MQMVDDLIYELFWAVTPGQKNKSACMVVVTVCAKNKTVGDLPQGEPGAVVQMWPPNFKSMFYFGTMWHNLTG
jgi:hypothetical protein